MSDNEINFPPPGFEQEVVYLQCKRNHATSLNLVSYDGCQEFLKAGVENNTEDAMLCAVCGCHRNFHVQYTIDTPKAQSETKNTPIKINSSVGPSEPHVKFGVNGESNPEKKTLLEPLKRKKRTVFTKDLRNRLTEFAERIKWTPKGANKEDIEHFCWEIGITRKTFLVWLSNNRHRAMKNDTKIVD